MFMNSLVNYYNQLAAAGRTAIGPVNSGGSIRISPLWYSSRGISYVIVLNPDGTIYNIEDIREDKVTKDKKPYKAAVRMIVPGVLANRTNTTKSHFLWDRCDYLMGFPQPIIKPGSGVIAKVEPPSAKSRKRFSAACQFHWDLQAAINDPEYDVVCAFFRHWQKVLDANTGKNLLPPSYAGHRQDIPFVGHAVFKVLDSDSLVCERPTIRDYWINNYPTIRDQIAKIKPVYGQCLITGATNVRLARVQEPGIKLGSKQGEKLSACSYASTWMHGLEENYNAPTGDEAAFRYATVLNHLIEDTEPRQVLRLGDFRVIYWAEQLTPATQQAVAVLNQLAMPRLGRSASALTEVIRTQLQRIGQGVPPENLELCSATMPFHLVGMTPKKGRIVVNFHHKKSFGTLLDNLRQHYLDLGTAGVRVIKDKDGSSGRITYIKDPMNLSLYTPSVLLLGIPDDTQKSILATQLLEAAMLGTPYPFSLYDAVLTRCLIPSQDGQNFHGLVALLKAYLTRLRPTNRQELTMSLNPDHPSAAYQLGRLFAVYEKLQASGKQQIATGIRQQFFAEVINTPAACFPSVVTRAEPYLHDLRQRQPGSFYFYSQLLHSIYVKLGPDGIPAFPRVHTLEDKGYFILGHQHQLAKFFTKAVQPQTAAFTVESNGHGADIIEPDYADTDVDEDSELDDE